MLFAHLSGSIPGVASLLIETPSCCDVATQGRWWWHVEASSVEYAAGVRWSREKSVRVIYSIKERGPERFS